jgi:hypothetical protein
MLVRFVRFAMPAYLGHRVRLEAYRGGARPAIGSKWLFYLIGIGVLKAVRPASVMR